MDYSGGNCVEGLLDAVFDVVGVDWVAVVAELNTVRTVPDAVCEWCGGHRSSVICVSEVETDWSVKEILTLGLDWWC